MSKVRFGIKNAYYSKITESEGTITYATPKALKGAINLSLSPVGENAEIYADDILYFNENVNNGYDGTLELALISDDFKSDILGEIADSNGVIEENATASQHNFALLCEFTTDSGATKFAFYNCSASRSEIAGSTKTATKEFATETINLQIRPNADGIVQRHTNDTTDSTVVNNWYASVYQSTISA